MALGEDYTVVDCEGPHEGEVCPAVEEQRCITAAHADVVICDFLPGDDHSRALPQAVARELREGASVIVQVARPAAETHADAVAGLRVLHHPVRREDLRGAVAAAVKDLAATPVRVVHGPRHGWAPPRLG
jgi:predicted metal-dependent phosphoesterase TrpH